MNQTYRETNTFANSAAIPRGQDGMWDFALKENGMTAGSGYCLRLSSGDGAALNSYTYYPEVFLAAAVYVNEVYPSSNTTGTDGWVELFNNTVSTPALIGWKLNYVQGAIGGPDSPTTVWTGAGGQVINAMSTFTISGLTLNRAGSYHVKVLNNAGNVVDQAQWPALSEGQSFARITDGDPLLFEIDPTPTKNYSNYVTTDALKINEVSYGALGGQFIELYNESVVSTRTLTGYSLRNSNGPRFTFTRKIYPQNYTVIDFSSIGDDALPYAGAVSAFGAQGLASGGDFLALENSTGSTVDHLTWQTDDTTGRSRYNYKAELVSAVNFAPANSASSISRRPTEGAETGSDAADFAVLGSSNIGSRNNGAGTAPANTLAYPLNTAEPQYLARKFPVTMTLGARSSTGTANNIIFTRTGGSGDPWSPHIYRLADIGFDLDALTSQTTVQTGFSFNDQDGHPLASSATYRVVFNTDTGTKSAPQIILGAATYGTAVHAVTASTAAPLWMNDAAKNSAIKLEISNNSPAGFGGLEVTTVTFKLLDPDLVALDTARARNLFNSIMLVRDSTSAGTAGLYEPGIDLSTIAYVPMADITLDAGLSTLTVLSPDLASASIPAASTRTFYVVFESTRDASGWAPDHIFRVRLNPQSTVIVRDGPSDLPQDFIPSAEVETSSVTLISAAQPPADTAWPYALPAQAVAEAAAVYYTYDPIWSPTNPIVSSATYVASLDGYIRAVNKDGTFKWEYPTSPLSPIRTSPNVRIEGGGLYIYFANDNGDVYKLRDKAVSEGPPGAELAWQKHPIGDFAIRSNIVDIDTEASLYFGAADKKVHCLKKADGTDCGGWSSISVGDSPIAGTMVLDSRAAVNAGWVANDDGDVMALKLGDGTLDQTFTTGGTGMKTSPYLDARVADPNNVIYFTSPNGNLYSRVSASMASRWAYPVGAAIHTSPFVTFSGPKFIFFGDDSGKLHKVTADGAGAPGWPYQAGGAIRSSPAWVPGGAVGVAADYVYFGCDDGYIYAVNADDGTRRPGWPVATGGAVRSDLVLDTDNGTLIANSTDGKVYVLNIGP